MPIPPSCGIPAILRPCRSCVVFPRRAPTAARLTGQPLTVTLNVADTNLAGARIVWEAAGQEPVFGTQSYTFSPGPSNGTYWIEAEVQWPDGRRAFATNSIIASTVAPPELSNPQALGGGGFSFVLAGTPLGTYVILASTKLTGSRGRAPSRTSSEPGSRISSV